MSQSPPPEEQGQVRYVIFICERFGIQLEDHDRRIAAIERCLSNAEAVKADAARRHRPWIDIFWGVVKYGGIAAYVWVAAKIWALLHLTDKK